MLSEFERVMIDLISKAEREVERHSQAYTEDWHDAIFPCCMRTEIAFFVLGDCIPFGFVFVDFGKVRVDAFDKDMSLLSSYKDRSLSEFKGERVRYQ